MEGFHTDREIAVRHIRGTPPFRHPVPIPQSWHEPEAPHGLTKPAEFGKYPGIHLFVEVGPMNRSDLVQRIKAKNPDLHAAEVDLLVRIVFSEIEAALVQGDRAEFRGFGSFSVRRHPAHIGRNPKSGESVEVPDKNMPYFRAGKELRKRVDTKG